MCEVSLHRVLGSQGYTHTIPYYLKTNKKGGENKETSLKMISSQKLSIQDDESLSKKEFFPISDRIIVCQKSKVYLLLT